MRGCFFHMRGLCFFHNQQIRERGSLKEKLGWKSRGGEIGLEAENKG